MKTRLAALLLCLSLLCSLTVQAAERTGGSTGLFTPSLTYDGRFTDVREEDWFYPHIATLFSLGLTRGQSDTLFGVGEKLSIKETIGFAARVRSLYFYGDAEAGAAPFASEAFTEEEWYLPYVLYLKDEQVLDDAFDSRMDQSASRAQTAHIAVSTLPGELFTEINADTVSVGYATRAFIPDVGDYTPYQQDILQLYRWGVVTGSDERGAFHPDDPITRSEFSALLTRLTDPSLRVALDWDISAYYSARAKTYASLVAPGAYYRSHAPGDLAAVDSNVRYMLAGGGSTLTLQLGTAGVTEAQVSSLMSDYLNTVRTYIEQGYNAVSCSYSGSTGRVTLRFYSSIFSDASFATARAKTLSEAIRVHDQLWADGTITAGMSEWERARVFYDYVCTHCVYDYQAVDSSVSHSAYSLFYTGSAVCDGYTAAYNLLLKLDGIACTTWSTESHIWTVATLNGRSYHIDATWGSQSPEARDAYFGMSQAASLARF